MNQAETNGKKPPFIQEVLDILEDLVDLQQGPPLLRYEKEWMEVMHRAEKILGRNGRGYEGQREK